jgi:hypothetical protein
MGQFAHVAVDTAWQDHRTTCRDRVGLIPSVKRLLTVDAYAHTSVGDRQRSGRSAAWAETAARAASGAALKPYRNRSTMPSSKPSPTIASELPT